MDFGSKLKQSTADSMDELAPKRDQQIKRNHYYYDDLVSFLQHRINKDRSILEIGSGTGYLFSRLKPKHGVGIDLSEKMVELAKKQHPEYSFLQMDAENIKLTEKYDYIIISDILGYLEDIQTMFAQLKKVSTASTRVILVYHNSFWKPLLNLAEKIGLKMRQPYLNNLDLHNVKNLAHLENFEVVEEGRRFLFPFNIPFLSNFINHYLAQLPIINRFCLVGYLVLRWQTDPGLKTVTVVVPARNEKGNIENVVKRIPEMGTHTEIIFIEGGSSDGTLEEIKRVCEIYSSRRDVKYLIQDGKGKGDAVRKAFDHATGDILMILDTDLSVPPEDLPKFYNAIANNTGEFINGSRLIYPMEKDSMRTLNLIANKMFSIVFSYALGQRLTDTLCGTKVMSKDNYQALIKNRSYFGDFDPFGDFDFLLGAAKLNLRIIEVPVRYKARVYGSTNISRFKHGLILIRMVIFAMNKIKFI